MLLCVVVLAYRFFCDVFDCLPERLIDVLHSAMRLQDGADLLFNLLVNVRIEDGFKNKIEKMIIIGTDCPDVNQNFIEEAFGALNSQDVVLGPARDGGYYLIGLSQSFPMLFNHIDWGSDRVLTQTKKIIKQENLSVYDLPVLTDVDRPDDLYIWQSKKVCLNSKFN
jgi:rSAM/selenodomain-associated transferase 1